MSVFMYVVGYKFCLSIENIDVWNARRSFSHPLKNVIQWLVDVLESIFFLSMRQGEAPQVQALACGPQHFMIVVQEASLKLLIHDLKKI